ncbi:MAG: NupC/NupG family nucleoside CNT transporter [bacterium]|nr:NupC/NupG family nucleoside CNT transporter [bacterium]
MDRFQGLLGVAAILGIAFAVSNNRKRINWRTVGWGLALQVLLAIFVIQVPIGRDIFSFLGQLVNSLIEFAKEGASFVFGSLIPPDTSKMPVNTYAEWAAMHHAKNTGFIFAFQVLPAIIFVGSLAGIAFYTGLMQLIIGIVAKLMVKTMGTSGAESIYAVSTVFVGQSEAPLFIRPYIEKMTRSELNSIMTGGMATIAGSVLFAYVAMLGPDLAPHVITASIMGAPAGLALSKMLCPEVEEPVTAKGAEISDEDKTGSLIEAISKGANDGMHLALIVGAQLIAFIALIATINGLLGWCGGFVNHSDFSIQTIFGWILGPMAWLMGCPWADAQTVGSLIGQKIVLNEMVAYTDLLKHIQEGTIDGKAKLLATYALCGFANFSSVGINIGCIGGLAPSRQGDVAKLGFRALLGGAMASLLTASLVGIIS